MIEIANFQLMKCTENDVETLDRAECEQTGMVTRNFCRRIGRVTRVSAQIFKNEFRKSDSINPSQEPANCRLGFQLTFELWLSVFGIANFARTYDYISRSRLKLVDAEGDEDVN